VTGRTSGPYKPVPLLCIVFLLEQAEEKRQEKPEAKDVLPNINRTPPAERAEKCCFLSLVTLTFKLVRARDQTCLQCEFGANTFSSSGDTSYTNKKTTD